MARRHKFDLAAYAERTRSGPCFICEFLAGNPATAHHRIGVPYEQQQYHALMAEHGILRLGEAEMADLAARIAREYATISWRRQFLSVPF